VETRAFQNDSLYQHGRVILQTRMARAFANRSAFGRVVQSRSWAQSEFDTLRLLRARGAAVPEPIAIDDRTILLEWVGDDDPAPQLRHLRLERDRAGRCLAVLLDQVAPWLSCHRVHGDLSAFNVLWHRDAPVVIDFPQAVDPRTNANARELLARDLRNLALCFARFGVAFADAGHAEQLWQRWQRGET
jgi:RIO kinase 1